MSSAFVVSRVIARRSYAGKRQELLELVGERDLGEELLRLVAGLDALDLARARAPRRTGRARTHCQSCEREISAVAASSIRLSIAAAPTPCSQASR